MTARLVTGALAATCSVILLGACSSGSQPTSTGQGASTPATAASSTTSAASATPSGTSTPSASGSSSAPAKPAAEAKITIKDFAYQVPISVKPGAKITITDMDGPTHTVTSDEAGLFDASIDGGGGSGTITAPTKPGKYPFHCTYHANMHGILVVS